MWKEANVALTCLVKSTHYSEQCTRQTIANINYELTISNDKCVAPVLDFEYETMISLPFTFFHITNNDKYILLLH